MSLLTPKIRKSIVEEICNKFYEDGISNLKIIGHIEKYTPLFYFRITKPNEKDFIYITELFGDAEIKSPFFNGGIRMQYHGNYAGLSRIILQGVNPFKNRPSFIVYAKEKKLKNRYKLKFDDSLCYLNSILKTMTPMTKNFEIGNDFFSKTYNL